MVPVIVLVVYLTGFVVTARYLVYKMMCYNETATFYGVKLSARVYSAQELYQIAKKASGGYLYRRDGISGDWNYILTWAAGWPLYTLKGLFMILTTKGLPKTPGQRENELRDREKMVRTRELQLRAMEEKNEKDFQNRLREAGIEDE